MKLLTYRGIKNETVTCNLDHFVALLQPSPFMTPTANSVLLFVGMQSEVSNDVARQVVEALESLNSEVYAPIK